MRKKTYERLIEAAKFRQAVLASKAQADRGEVVSQTGKHLSLSSPQIHHSF